MLIDRRRQASEIVFDLAAVISPRTMTFALATIHDFGTGKDVPHVITDFGFTSVIAAFDFSKVDTGFDLAPIFNAAFDLAPVSTTASTPDFNAIYSGTSTTKLALSSLPVSSVLFLFMDTRSRCTCCCETSGTCEGSSSSRCRSHSAGRRVASTLTPKGEQR